jgi:hypothetical protein
VLSDSATEYESDSENAHVCLVCYNEVNETETCKLLDNCECYLHQGYSLLLTSLVALKTASAVERIIA